jgi:hypothetical protein
MRRFINCVVAFLGSFLPDLGWIALASLVACLIAGGLAALLASPTGPGAAAAFVAIFVSCLKLLGIILGALALICLEEGIRNCL